MHMVCTSFHSGSGIGAARARCEARNLLVSNRVASLPSLEVASVTGELACDRMQIETSRDCPPRSSSEVVGASPSSPGKDSNFANSRRLSRAQVQQRGFLVHAKIMQRTPELDIFALLACACTGLL